jgi:predicted HicB family RNase H-like nuclease
MSLLKPGRPSAKTAKELAIEAVQDIADVSSLPVKVKMQRFNVDIPAELHRAMKIQATQEGLKLNELTIKIFQAYLGKAGV